MMLSVWFVSTGYIYMIYDIYNSTDVFIMKINVK